MKSAWTPDLTIAPDLHVLGKCLGSEAAYGFVVIAIGMAITAGRMLDRFFWYAKGVRLK